MEGAEEMEEAVHAEPSFPSHPAGPLSQPPGVHECKLGLSCRCMPNPASTCLHMQRDASHEHPPQGAHKRCFSTPHTLRRHFDAVHGSKVEALNYILSACHLHIAQRRPRQVVGLQACARSARAVERMCSGMQLHVRLAAWQRLQTSTCPRSRPFHRCGRCPSTSLPCKHARSCSSACSMSSPPRRLWARALLVNPAGWYDDIRRMTSKLHRSLGRRQKTHQPEGALSPDGLAVTQGA
jgi:hypothetical protein